MGIESHKKCRSVLGKCWWAQSHDSHLKVVRALSREPRLIKTIWPWPKPGKPSGACVIYRRISNYWIKELNISQNILHIHDIRLSAGSRINGEISIFLKKHAQIEIWSGKNVKFLSTLIPGDHILVAYTCTIWHIAKTRSGMFLGRVLCLVLYTIRKAIRIRTMIVIVCVTYACYIILYHEYGITVFLGDLRYHWNHTSISHG